MDYTSTKGDAMKFERGDYVKNGEHVAIVQDHYFENMYNVRIVDGNFIVGDVVWNALNMVKTDSTIQSIFKS